MADYDEIDEQDEEVEQPKKNWRRELEDRARTAEEERARLERELAFVKAGVDFSDPKAKYFVKGYEGEVNAEAIKTAWEEGFGAGKTEEIPAEEVKAHQEIAQAAIAAPATRGGATTDRLKDLRDKLYSGNPQVAATVGYQDVMQAISDAGLAFGTVDHDGTFTPTK